MGRQEVVDSVDPVVVARSFSPTAVCPKCMSKNTKRAGYDRVAHAGEWKCGECGQEFKLASLVLFKSST